MAFEAAAARGGARWKDERYTLRKLEREGYRFEILSAMEAVQNMPRFRTLSNEWLTAKHTREKRFSLGNFEEAYLRHFPHAVVRNDAGIVAFANLWAGAGHEELSIDLMRYGNSAPNSVMEFLFLHLMLWGRQEGYRWFSLGMAPLAGLENRPHAPMWNRLGGLLYEHGEHFYNFRGLRQYKEKFNPVWEPRYLASPGGLAIPTIVANVATPIAGGMRGIAGK